MLTNDPTPPQWADGSTGTVLPRLAPSRRSYSCDLSRVDEGVVIFSLSGPTEPWTRLGLDGSLPQTTPWNHGMALHSVPAKSSGDWFMPISELRIKPPVAPRPASGRADSRAAVPAQIVAIQEATGWSDAQLARAFPGALTRETINRWKNQPGGTLKPNNLYRLGVLARLAESLVAARVEGPTWLRQPVLGTNETPYDLICAGRAGEVQAALDTLVTGFGSPEIPMNATAKVSFGWDNVLEDEDEDDFVWSSADETCE